MTQKKKNQHTESRNESGTREQGNQTVSRQGGSNIEKKIEELESEWTVERIKEVAGAAFVLLGVFLAVKNRRKLEEFGQKVASVLGVESLNDWTPPEGLLNMLGIRKQDEVDTELQKLQSRLA